MLESAANFQLFFSLHDAQEKKYSINTNARFFHLPLFDSPYFKILISGLSSLIANVVTLTCICESLYDLF